MTDPATPEPIQHRTPGPLGLGVHVVLHEPEIPNNTGSIGRACVAMGCPLHLIHPLGFSLDEKALRRAGLDYWPRLDLHEHTDWASFLQSRLSSGTPSIRPSEPRVWLFTTSATRSVFQAEIRLGDALVFGKETAGLPQEILAAHPDRCVSIPMMPKERSLNLACSAVAAMSEAMRQAINRGDRELDPNGRIRPEE